MVTKLKTSADLTEDRLVYDKPVTLQRQIPDSGAWENVQHLHANVNKAVSGNNFSAENERLRTKLLFRLRYFPALEDVRNSPQNYRIDYFGQHYEITDYDDYNERRRVIKLTAERYELPVTVEVLVPSMTNVLGVMRKVYSDSGFEADCEWINTKTDEKAVNGVVSVTEQARITVRSRSGITAACRIRRTDGSLWDIIGAPDNTGLSERWQVFTVQRVTGGA